MPNVQEIYQFLKDQKDRKFRSAHLAKVFKIDKKTMDYYLSRILKNVIWYPGFKRQKAEITGERGQIYLCYMYFVEVTNENKS